MGRNYSPIDRRGRGAAAACRLWTPMAGVLVVIAELWTAVSRPDDLRSCAILASLGAALLMLGPGVRSDRCPTLRTQAD